MRRTLLSVGVQAGGLRFAKENRPAIFRTRRFLSPPNSSVSLPKSGGKPEKRLAVRQVFFWCVRRGSNPDRERRRALNLTPYVYFYAFSSISCIFLCYFLHNCPIFSILQGVKYLAGVNRV